MINSLILSYNSRVNGSAVRPTRLLLRIIINNIKPQPTEYKQARENMTDTSNVTNTHNGHGFLNLGLPSGTLWATCNVGATSPEQAGLHLAWGETEGYTTEQVKNGTRKFDSASYTAPSDSDNLTLEQDAARANLDGNWRMPTLDEWQELYENCNVVGTDDYNGTGVKGSVFTSRVNGNSVFFPDPERGVSKR